MSDFKKCPFGHTYDSEKEKECPYCNGRKIDDELKKIPPKDIEGPESAMCYDMGVWRHDDLNDEDKR